MEKLFEISLDSDDGVVDCQLEEIENERGTYYSIVILYPHIVQGISMSKVYDHELFFDKETDSFHFSNETGIHPKIKMLEGQISSALSKIQ